MTALIFGLLCNWLGPGLYDFNDDGIVNLTDYAIACQVPAMANVEDFAFAVYNIERVRGIQDSKLFKAVLKDAVIHKQTDEYISLTWNGMNIEWWTNGINYSYAWSHNENDND